METVKQVFTTVAQAGAKKPAGAASSVFDMASRPRRVMNQLDPGSVVIRTGVPIPAPTMDRKFSPYELILKKMKSGDCVELSDQQAQSMRVRAKVLKIEITARKTGLGKTTVWRS